MYEAEKLDEAGYFLKQMASVAEDRKAHKHNLSAFLSAGRSVLQFASKEATSKPSGQAWAGNPVVKFFKHRRDVSIHAESISPIKEIQAQIEETLHLDMRAEAVVISDGRVVPSEPQRQASRLPEGTNWPYPSKVTMSEAFRFSEWKGTEDVTTLCSMYLTELQKIVADGRSKGYLTP